MKSSERPLKGGLGGKSTRMRERFRVETPDQEVLEKYLVYFSGKSLYQGLQKNEIPSPENIFSD